jgi:uncharacterized protein (TIGR02284 family)
LEKKKIIDLLNRLLVTNIDRIEGYKTAIENTLEKELETLFSKFSQTSQIFRYDLVTEIERLGGIGEEHTNESCKRGRALIDLKSALSGNDRKAILNSCNEGEEKAIESYKSVLENKSGPLTSKQVTMVRDQYGSIKSDHDEIRLMQSALVDTP